jgi:hypothetical protein
VSALNEYASRHGGRYPDSLDVLVTPDQDGLRYLQAEKLPKDPWNRAYFYEPPHADAGSNQPHVWSFGPDGRPDGGDDIDSGTMEDGH